jgi:hypothetical protein
MKNAKGSEKGHYFFAAALLAHYLRILQDSATEADDQRVASRIAGLIDLGRKLLSPNGEPESVH